LSYDYTDGIRMCFISFIFVIYSVCFHSHILIIFHSAKLFTSENNIVLANISTFSRIIWNRLVQKLLQQLPNATVCFLNIIRVKFYFVVY